MRGADALDADARDQITAEVARHAKALCRIRAIDREAFAAELDRHLDRVGEILADHARRASAPTR